MIGSIRALSVLLNVSVWAGLAYLAARHAGNHTFASCWGLLLVYFPPLMVSIIVVFLASVVLLLMGLFRADFRKLPTFDLSIHGLIIVSGMLLARWAAWQHGPWQCL